MRACVRASYFLHERALHSFLYLSPAAPLVFVPRFRTHVHTDVRRVDYRLRFRANYTFTVHALVSADFASRAVRTWFPRRNQGGFRNAFRRSPSKCVREIKSRTRENILIKVTVKKFYVRKCYRDYSGEILTRGLKKPTAIRGQSPESDCIYIKSISI